MTRGHPIFDLQRKCYECQECVLGRREVERKDPHVFGSGSVNARIMFVGEAPGKDEVE
jgi:uracil-DNA glycosylase